MVVVVLCSAILLVIWRHLVINVADQRYSHLRCVVATQDVADEVGLDLHMDLLVVSAGLRSRSLDGMRTISSAPRRTPTSILENHSSSCARPSSGSSTKSARGFSSKMSENCLLSLVQLVMVGVTLRKILKPTCPHSMSYVRDTLTVSSHL